MLIFEINAMEIQMQFSRVKMCTNYSYTFRYKKLL